MHDSPESPVHRRRGYTLIELMLVIGMLGLAGAMLVPQLVDQNNMAVQAAVRQIIADLSFAQSDALAHQEFRRVHFYDDGRGYCLLRATEADYAVAFAGLPLPLDYIVDPLGSAGNLGNYIVDFTADDRYEGITITAADLDGASFGAGGVDLVYDQLGGTIRGAGLPGIGGRIEITAGDDVYEILVSPFTGKLSVREM